MSAEPRRLAGDHQRPFDAVGESQSLDFPTGRICLEIQFVDATELLEVCAVFATRFGDVDGIDDLASRNDRLLLGLNGTMSEAELHILKQRMREGKRAKARRGALGMRPPMGYVHAPSVEVIEDPDEQAQAVMALIFEVFERTGTLHGL